MRPRSIDENPRGDFSIVGLFDPHVRVYLDVRVWNHLCKSHAGKPVADVHRAQEGEKNRMYKARIEEYENGRFLPVVFNTAGSASPGAELFMKALARHIEASGAMSFATAMAFMRARVTLILARSASECLRGTHEKKDRTEFIRAQDFARRQRADHDFGPGALHNGLYGFGSSVGRSFGVRAGNRKLNIGSGRSELRVHLFYSQFDAFAEVGAVGSQGTGKGLCNTQDIGLRSFGGLPFKGNRLASCQQKHQQQQDWGESSPSQHNISPSFVGNF